MERLSQRKHKSNVGKVIGFIVIVCILFVVCIFIGTKIGEKSENDLSVNGENEYDEILSDEDFEDDETYDMNVVNNTISEEEIIAVKNVNNAAKKNSNSTVQTGITDKKQEAIKLVEKEWGDDDSVNFVFDYVNENGEYVIAVKDKSTSTVRNYFKVNLTTKSVEIDY